MYKKCIVSSLFLCNYKFPSHFCIETRNCRGWNPQMKIIKSANQQRRILEPEKTYSSSSPLLSSLFIMYLYLEAINVLLNRCPQTTNEPLSKTQPLLIRNISIELDENDNVKHKLTSSYKASAIPRENKLNFSSSWS